MLLSRIILQTLNEFQLLYHLHFRDTITISLQVVVGLIVFVLLFIIVSHRIKVCSLSELQRYLFLKWQIHALDSNDTYNLLEHLVG